MALTCGEESSGAFNGADYLVRNQHALVDAAFALNEGGAGREDDQGRAVWLGLQVGEKLYQDFQFEVTNPGGHSARPTRDNAITRLSAGLVKLGAYDFPLQFTDTTRAYFARAAQFADKDTGAAVTALLANPQDAAAEAVVTRDRNWNGMLRTTCTATMVTAGHAPNALPQRAAANINCRIFPGTTVAQVQARLDQIIADPDIKVTVKGERNAPSGLVPLDPAVVGPAEKLAAEMFPGVPIIPVMTPGATDGAFVTPAGIPTYGAPGLVWDVDGNGVHGLNERIRVSALYKGRDYLYRLVKLYAEQPER
jgi:acetylornithine deacetylase/succinyl-diaminopimelate desuccinylase-like protein